MPPPRLPNSSGSSRADRSRWASRRSWRFPKRCRDCWPTRGSPWSVIPQSSHGCAPIRNCCRARSTSCCATPESCAASYRRATADVELGGVTIAEGELAALMLASANRDPEQFPDPDRLDLARPVTSHVALGTGRNSCVGADADPDGGFSGHRRAGRDVRRSTALAGWASGARVPASASPRRRL